MQEGTVISDITHKNQYLVKSMVRKMQSGRRLTKYPVKADTAQRNRCF